MENIPLIMAWEAMTVAKMLRIKNGKDAGNHQNQEPEHH